ncbi:MAG: SUMF1/EgtB/PvdO family nonheme iron enzyme [Planctomycetaceae bacterium]|nr:SUMF1/EgtB/PvdO family nonheme iron enzyme [Planctomycetaceae bacterium]
MRTTACLFVLFFAVSPLLLFGETAPQYQPQGKNVFSFDPMETKFVRLWVDGGNNGPCIDEMEVFAPNSEVNLALASLGVKATASSEFPNNPQHKIAHINDGRYGNPRSWIPAGNSGWIQLEFPEPATVDRVVISRDRGERRFMDRGVVALEIFVSQDGENWTSVKKTTRFASWLDGNNNDRPMNTPETVRRAVLDMIQEYGDRYPNGAQALSALDDFDKRFAAISADSPEGKALQTDFATFQRVVLLANPVLDFDKILVIRGNRMAAPNNNFMTLDDVPKRGFDNELAVLSNLRAEPTLTTVYRSPDGRPIGEPELHWDGRRVMFSSISSENNRWAVFEVNIDGTGLKTLTPTDQPDVDFYDSCYVPDGTIIAASNASMQGLPCLGGGGPIANLYKVDPVTKNVRQLTFDQDSAHHPVMMSDGRVMYVRWEYSDIMHYYSRILFHMNPDGTAQRELYGSGSHFPTTMKHPREIPGTSEIIIILSGHHGRGDTGRLAIIDPAVARKYPFIYRPTSKEWGVEGTKINVMPEVLPASQTGFIQEIPGYGLDVVGNVVDNMADGLTYNFVFPYPLSKNYFLVNCQIAGDDSTYGLYLVDRFDNMTLIKKIDNQGLFNPIPLVRSEPPVLRPDRTDPASQAATVFITNIYDGVGTRGVPTDSIKSLRVYAFHFAYNGRGGHDVLGVHTGWDVKRLLGEVPVETDGSVTFEIPANMPLALQPLDEQGRAVQLMRSWFVGMPGENVSCNGCHESQLEVTPVRSTIAARKSPEPIQPFFGPARTITFETEVYHPLVRPYCMECHDGSKPDRPSFANVDLAYRNIHPFVRRPGPETDMEPLQPMEYHVSTSELYRMLTKNHYNVTPGDEALRRLYCWIDLNAPLGGKWNHPQQSQRRQELEALYSIRVDDYESDFDQQLRLARENPRIPVPVATPFVAPVDSARMRTLFDALATREYTPYPFDTHAAKRMQEDAARNGETRKTITLAPGIEMGFVLVPRGLFVMGDLEGYPDSSPRNVVVIASPFWMSETEITNAQYALFDPVHDTRYIEEHGKDHVVPGYIANHPNQPVARISWDEAMQFAAWFSKEFAVSADLPTEAEWEWAARAGADTRYPYGTFDTDFSKFANLAGAERRYLYTSWIDGSTIHRRNPYPADSVFPLRDDRFSDRWFTVDYVAQYEPNAWGLYDMIGNVSEWTKSSYRPYSYVADDGRNDPASRELKVARGGSWHDRPKSTGSATRYAYEPWQKVHDVGVRIVLRTQ